MLALRSKTEAFMKNCIVVIGKESVGKSRLIHSLTGKYAYSANFRGATVACECYECADGQIFVDTPGIFRQSDGESARLVLDELRKNEIVLLVAQATHLEEDLRDLLPLARGKRGLVAVTFRDKFPLTENFSEIADTLQVPFVPLDARSVTETEKTEIFAALENPQTFQPIESKSVSMRAIPPRQTLIEKRFIGAGLAVFLIFLPAVLAVWLANSFAFEAEILVKNIFAPLVEIAQNSPAFLSFLLAGNYGLLTMFPLMFVWALPIVALYAAFLAVYKTSGLLDRVTCALHPLVRPFGLEGRDLLRVVMGFGCNVPAVINSRSCSACTRGVCVSAISFGSACSYQFAAAIGVFAAVQKPSLIVPYLGYLLVTTLIFARLTAPKEAFSKRNLLVVEGRTFLQTPAVKDIWREMRSTLRDFFRQALPVFLIITLAASVLDFFGAMRVLSNLLAPFFAVFDLPAEAASAIIFSALRKDGILLLANQTTASVLSAWQILTAVYLAGVAVPCLVTALTISREMSVKFAVRLLAKQFAAAVVFTIILALAGKVFAAF
jgi:ferrous iron transport protein B